MSRRGKLVLGLGLVKVILVQDHGIGEDVSQQPRERGLPAGRAPADADYGGFPVIHWRARLNCVRRVELQGADRAGAGASAGEGGCDWNAMYSVREVRGKSRREERIFGVPGLDKKLVLVGEGRNWSRQLAKTSEKLARLEPARGFRPP